MAKGQITIYVAISFSLILSMFLAGFEAVRTNALQSYMDASLECGLCSAFGEYNKELLERYDLLYVDMSYMTNQPDSKKLSARIDGYVSDTLDLSEGQHLLFVRDLFDVRQTNVSLTGYRLATDNFGASFKSQAVDYMEDKVSMGLLDNVNKWASAREEYDLTQECYKAKRSYAENAVNEGLENAVADDEWIETVNKDFDVNMSLFSGLDVLVFGLEGVFKDRSSKGVRYDELLIKRKLNKGSGEFELDKANPMEELIFDEYIMEKLGCYTKTVDDTALDYEIEYVLFGQEADGSNLSFTMMEIFFIRAAANVITISTDQKKMEAIKDASEILNLICKYVPKEAWEATLVCVWAGLEGVSDIKHLLKGERIPLIKEGKDMRVSITGVFDGESLPEIPKENGQLVEDDKYELGLTYRDYLRILLLTVPPPIKVYRVMSIIEQDIRLTKGNTYFRFDACTDAVGVVMTLQSGFGKELVAERKYYYF